MAVHAQWRSQKCPACGTQLLSGIMGITEIGSPLMACPKCGKTSYTKMRREWYNNPDKDLLLLIPLVMAMGIGAFVSFDHKPLSIFVGTVMLAFAIGSGVVEMVRIVQSKKRMRDPEYLAELLRWRIIRQEEYECFMRNVRQ